MVDEPNVVEEDDVDNPDRFEGLNEPFTDEPPVLVIVEPSAESLDTPPAGLVLKPFAFLLRHTPIRPKTGTIDAVDALDAKERIRLKYGFNTHDDFEVEITPQG